MSKRMQAKKPLAIAVGAALATSFGAATMADASPFAMTALGAGYMVAVEGEGKCGEGKCGGGKGDKDMFEALDTNADGEITEAEHAAFWDAKFVTWDENKDEQLTETEFESAAKRHHSDKGDMDADGGGKEGEGKCGEGKCGGGKGGHLADMADKMDTDGDAGVDRAEFAAYWDAKFRAVDADGDGRVTESEMQDAKREHKDDDDEDM